MREERVLRESDVVFMYGAKAHHYRAYGATWVAWGYVSGRRQVKRHHDLGVRCTGTIWCLTAGAKLGHENPELGEAVARDIEGRPVAVPWLSDHVCEGSSSQFGCTNHPAFRALNRRLAREAMAGGADGLHIDDPRGVAAAAASFGGGFCDHCMAAFREYLRHGGEDVERQLEAAGVSTLEGFDYRDIVRLHAVSREAYLKAQAGIPLMDLFLRFHAEAAAQNVHEIFLEAQDAARHPICLSANAFGMDASFRPILDLEEVTHVVCEVPHQAHRGTADLQQAVDAYRGARDLGKPIAATASGQDWAWVKAHDAVNLVKVWVALAYACGQRFMVPHPTQQWCHTDFFATHWYAAPVAVFAPMYRFIRAHADCFDGYVALAEGCGDGVVVDPERGRITAIRVPGGARAAGGAAAVIHVINTDYRHYDSGARERDTRTPQRDVVVRVPASLCSGESACRVFSFDGDEQTVPLVREGAECVLRIPELRVWTVCAVD